MYVWQMNNGRWQVDALTSQSRTYGAACFNAPSFATKADAQAWKAETICQIEHEERSAAIATHYT